MILKRKQITFGDTKTATERDAIFSRATTKIHFQRPNQCNYSLAIQLRNGNIKAGPSGNED